MRFFLYLIFFIATAYAVSINNIIIENPYLICEKNDNKCIKNQLKICHKDYKECLKSSKPKIFQALFGKCNIIGRQCNEILIKKIKPTHELTSYEPTKENVRTIGRTAYQDGYLWLGLTGAGIEYKFNGEITTINVTADTTSYSEDKPAHIIIYADDEIYLDTVMTEKNTDFKVIFDKKGSHVVRFIKTSEALFGSIRINEIKADKKISPTEPEKLKMEFIGDSITCGYGVDGTGTDVFTTRTEDGTKSYAIKTAKKFHAEYSIVAYSAFCVVPFLAFDGKIMNSVPGIYDRLGYSEKPNEFDDGVYELQNTIWDQQQFIPDLVVINLGTNDYYFGQNIATDNYETVKADYVDRYEKFITQIRSLYPETKILCTLGMMGQELYTEIEEAVNNYTSKTGDTNVKSFKLSVQNTEKNGLGTDGHPNAKSHVDATYEIVEAIEKLFGWKSDKDVNIELTD